MPEVKTEVSFGPPLVQTPEDAVMAFLRHQISEKELREAFAGFGVNPEIQFQSARNRTVRPDAAFETKIPDDLYDAAAPPKWDVEARLGVMEAKQKLKDEATKRAKKDETLEATQERETSEVREELEKKFLVPAQEKLVAK